MIASAYSQPLSRLMQRHLTVFGRGSGDSFKDDFAKYRGSQSSLTLNAFFNGILGQIGQQFSHKEIMNANLELANRGSLAEQFVGQQLLYSKPEYVNPELYYWHPPKSEAPAKVDFLYVSGNTIIPVEVKAGRRGSLSC